MPIKKSEISLNPLKKAASSLKNALAKPKDEYIRDAVIQRFEYTFELSWKIIKRYIEANNNTLEHNLKNLFREAAKQGLITQVEDWFEYLRVRNLTSHTYNENVAEETYRVAKKFSDAADSLIKNLEKLLV